MADAALCPHCGTPTPGPGWEEELCPACLMALALSPAGAAEGEAVAGPDGERSPSGEALEPGRVLGGRYRIRESLGRGGMGEVWRGFDLKLRVDVALKAVRRDRAGGRTGLEGLRREVRMARQVVSPNVCRVFDLVELEGRELVSMEFVDGATLAEVLRERSPLPIGEAQEIASQLLAGLRAIHEAGLVHRDLKPENVMLTRAGRVVVMDLGIAHWAAASRADTLAGTPPYMPPEQARGDAVDLRTDLFAAGVLLAEMVAPGGVASDAARRRVWDGVAEDPPRIDETPWAAVLRRAVAREPGRRQENAAALARELEEVTQRATVGEGARPYPGLTSFGVDDSAYFYGRELEVGALWHKLRRPGLLGLIGPSGAGKSSFLRAGLLASRPRGWGVLVATPGDRPLGALTRALRPGDGSGFDLGEAEPDDPETLVPRFEAWRMRHDQALLVVDQFEELFTLNPEPVQLAFVALLRRLTLETDVHVLLAMRDDFLFRCQGFEELAPVFADLTPLGAPTGASLRRAIVQPALRCGYRFEDEALVESMIAEVERERGALPLLAFACAQLWELRDRERGLLTRAACEEIGGVSGALARHADATLGTIGRERDPIVREIFRNLVTPQGTRVARDREELLSVFAEADRAAASEVLDALVASRLLVSFEAVGEQEPSLARAGGAEAAATRRHVEIVHESLLTRWPSLVRWRAQDAEGAVLREQLRQAATLWERHGRAEDYLWTGTAYREFRLWRERYPGGLTAVEEDFGAAMTSFAQRRLRRRRAAAAAGFALLATGLGVVTVLRQRAVAEMHRAEAEALRAEAAKILALGQLELERNPTAALAYTIKSLELADSREARIVALRALASGPLAFLHPIEIRQMGPADRVVFSPDGAWAAVLGGEKYHLLSREGGSPALIDDFPSGTGVVSGAFDPSGERFFAAKDRSVRIWDLAERRLLETQSLSGSHTRVWTTRAGVLATTRVLGQPRTVEVPAAATAFATTQALDQPRKVEVVAVAPGAAVRRIGLIEDAASWDIDAEGRALALVKGGSLVVEDLADGGGGRRWLARFEGGSGARFHPDGERFLDYDSHAGQVRILSAPGGVLRLDRGFPTPLKEFVFDRTGRRLAAFGTTGRKLQVDLWDLEAPVAATAWSFPAGFGDFLNGAAFSPDGRWLATANNHAVCFWPLAADAPRIFRGHEVGVTDVRFTPDGSSLVSVDRSGVVRQWALRPGGTDRVLTHVHNWSSLDVDPAGRFVAVAQPGGARIVPLGPGEERSLSGFGPTTYLMAVAVDREGRRVAAASLRGPREDKVIRVWDLETGDVVTLGPIPQAGESFRGMHSGLGFLPDGSLVSAGTGGVLRWSLPGGESEFVAPSYVTSHLTPFADGRSVAHVVGTPRETSEGGAGQFEFNRVAITDLTTRETRVLRSHGDRVMPIAVDPSGSVVASGGLDTIVRVGPVSGEEPYLLIGHEGPVHTVDISPDGRWVASGGDDQTVRVWPMPDFSRPPLQTLPLDQLLARLRSKTNVRVVEDSASTINTWLRTERGGGYELELDPFPGWTVVPE